MKAYEDNFATLYIADALTGLAELPERSVHLCVCSPPYFGLRAYLDADHADKGRELGTEATPESYVENLVEVFRGVWRVLRDDGTLWLNISDSYAGGGGLSPGLKPKDLIGIPWLLAFALRADGWTLRSEIVWAKKSPMPESIRDRPTSATEKVFLLSKKPRYFYDAVAVKETDSGRSSGNGFVRPQRLSYGERGKDEQWQPGGGRNQRNFWLLGPAAYKGSHFAVFPPEIPLRAIRAGSSERGVCGDCGAPWKRVVERIAGFTDGFCNGCGAPRNKHVQGAKSSLRPQENYGKTSGSTTMLEDGAVPCGAGRTVGWEPTCKCVRRDLRTLTGRAAAMRKWGTHPDTVPATVLDPFAGSGTTLYAARKLGRRSIGIDIDERSAEHLRQRLGTQGVMF